MSSSNLPILSPQQRAFYGVQLKNTAFRSWESLENNQSRLVYHFETNPTFRRTLQNTLIAVTRAYPDADESEIKTIASTIKQTEKITLFDPVFGIESQSIRRLGFVSDKNIDDREVTLNIQWIDESNELFGFVKGNIFKEDAELQMLTSREFRQIEKQYGNELQQAYRQMPETMLSSHLDYARIAEPEYRRIRGSFEKEQLAIKEAKIDHGGTVRLFYGTNRNRLDFKDGIQRYGGAEERELKYGVCDIHIPRNHKLGKLERPNALERFINWPESEKRHYVIKGVGELAREVFLADFIARLNEKPKKHALLFVHGYANTFDDAAYRAAQLAWDLPFKGYAGFYSWPSSGTTSAYGNDEAAARSSAPLLKEFIMQIAGIPDLEQIHIIAHSMGGLITTLSLNLLSIDPAVTNELDKVYQLILGAPDIDKNEFFNTILPEFRKLGKQRTLYASDHDYALNISASLRSLRDRLGQISASIFVADGLDTVNASNLKTSDSHGYLFEGRDILSDIFQIINSGSVPEDRRLREIPHSPLNYWLFPE